MKPSRILLGTLLAVVLLIPVSVLAGDVSVRGHWRDTNHDGVKDTYVEPYHRTSPDSTRTNNYDTSPNVNPWTGKQGTDSPYDSGSGSGSHQKKNLFD